MAAEVNFITTKPRAPNLGRNLANTNMLDKAEVIPDIPIS